MGVIEICLLCAILFYLIYKWSTQTYKVFEERGVPHQKPLPFIGNALKFIQNKESLHKIMLNVYRENKQHKIFGYYNFRQPYFLVNDPALIKKFAIKDFDAFTNHQKFFDNEHDKLMRGLLTDMKDQRWRDMRNTMTPAFTGAKMRTMFTLMIECFEENMKYLDTYAKSDGQGFDIELKDCFSRLSNDLIATTAFGLKVNSFVDGNNEFYTIGQSFTKVKPVQALKFMMYSLAPKLCKLLGLKQFDQKNMNYMLRLFIDTINYREEHNIVRPDMVQLLLEAKQDPKNNWTIEELVAQCFIFFFAAFENNANLLCTTCHELMENPEIQQKLYDECMETEQALNGATLDYDALAKMKYMDMVIAESLRKWTFAALIDRECGKDYTVKDDDGNFVCELKKGDAIWLQTIGLHWDEEYFEQPEIFDPERFSDENKKKIDPATYLPFGLGPRNCIGNRYALMQAKAMLYYLLKVYKLERSVKTCQNLFDDLRGFTLAPKSGFWVKLVKRA